MRGLVVLDVLPYFLRSEANERGADPWHGGSGPLHVSDQESPRPISYAFIQAANELQFRTNDDFNGPGQEGVGLYQVTQFHDRERNGERCSAAAAYLHPGAGRANLTIVTKAHATKIEFEGKRATGVRYRVGGAEKRVQANREIILCGGASPRRSSLQLSGVGRPDDLRATGSASCTNFPASGRTCATTSISSWPISRRTPTCWASGRWGWSRPCRHILRWRKDGTGLIASPGRRSRRVPEDGSIARQARHPASFLSSRSSTTSPQAASRDTVTRVTYACFGRARPARCFWKARIPWRRRASIRATSRTPRISRS